MPHGPVCPCCAGETGPGPLAPLVMLPALILELVIVAAARFATGRLLHRGASQWDAGWLTWAPEAPAWAVAASGEPAPRSRWARRPGWHRQVVRLPLLALGVLALLSPLTAALVGAGLAAAVGALVARCDVETWAARPVGPTPAPAVSAGEAPAWPAMDAPAPGWGLNPGRGRHDEHDPARELPAPAPIRVTARRVDREDREGFRWGQ